MDALELTSRTLAKLNLEIAIRMNKNIYNMMAADTSATADPIQTRSRAVLSITYGLQAASRRRIEREHPLGARIPYAHSLLSSCARLIGRDTDLGSTVTLRNGGRK